MITQANTVKKPLPRLGSRKAWWFTVIASSTNALPSLDEAWETSKPDAGWTLLKYLRDCPFLWHKQSHPHQNLYHQSLALFPQVPRFPPFPSTLSNHTQTIPSHSHPTWKTCSLPPTAPCPATTSLNFHQLVAVAPNQYSLSIPYPLSPQSSGNCPAPQVPPQNSLTQAQTQADNTPGTSSTFLVTGLPLHHTLCNPPCFNQPLEFLQATPPAPSNLSCSRAFSSLSTSSQSQVLDSPKITTTLNFSLQIFPLILIL